MNEPKRKNAPKKVKKRNYNNYFGEENSLKKFQNSLLIHNGSLKDN